MTRIAFCGAFNGTVTLRKGETESELHTRIEEAIQAALDRQCKRLNVTVGVDYGDLIAELELQAQ